jgi:hypothetical protein
MTRRYFKTEVNTATSGHRVFYVEFDGNQARRQVTIRNGEWSHSRLDLGRPDPDLMDQPLEAVDPSGHQEISPTEFEELWQEALNRTG